MFQNTMQTGPAGAQAGALPGADAGADAASGALPQDTSSLAGSLFDWLTDPLYLDVTPIHVALVLVLVPIVLLGAAALKRGVKQVLDSLEIQSPRVRDYTVLIVQYGTIAIGVMIGLRLLALDELFTWINRPLLGDESENKKVTPLNVILVVGIVLLSFQVSKAMQRVATRILTQAGIDNEAAVGTVSRLIHYTIVTIGFFFGVDQLGFELKTLFTAGAVFAVVIGFAMQNISQNFVAGVILLIERTIKPGDVLEVEGQIVRVVEMGIRVTVARTLDEEELIIPNSTLAQTTVKNYTLRDSLYRVRARVGVTYGSDMEVVLKTLEETARTLEWRTKDRAPRIHMLGFGDNSVDWEVSVWIQNPWNAPRHRSRLYQALWWALKEKGIGIAFPQLDVHLDRRAEALLEKIGASLSAAGASGEAAKAPAQAAPPDSPPPPPES